MSNEIKYIIGIGLITLAIFIGAVFFLSKGSQAEITASPADTTILYRNDKHKITAKNAKVTIVEFADFQCPACGNTHPALKKLLDTYKGKITFIYRHFPLPQHKNALLAARASEAAHDQGKFWEMHDMLYEHQEEWSERIDADTIFVQYAQKLHLNTKVFADDIASSKYDQSIQSDKEDGIRIGVNSTPSVYINGSKLPAYPSYENLKESVDAL